MRYCEFETRWMSDQKIGRMDVLIHLLPLGWNTLTDSDANSEESEWDLELGGFRLLVAQEVYDEYSVILTRVKMPRAQAGCYPKSLERVMRNLGLKGVCEK